VTPLACTIAFVALSRGQVLAIGIMTLCALVLAYLLGRDDGAVRERRQLFKQAKENGVDPRWLMQVPLDDGSDGE
jgi:hypothetical protein